MRVKIFLDIEVNTKWQDVKECHVDTFNNHVEYILRQELEGLHDGDLDYKSTILAIEFPNFNADYKQ